MKTKLLKCTMIKNIYTLLYGGLIFACAFPSMNMFYDRWNTPKWLCTLFLTGLLAVCTAILGHNRKKTSDFSHFSVWSEAATMIVTQECLYALMFLFKYPTTWRIGIAGTFDNPAGLAFFLCALLPFISGMALRFLKDNGKRNIYITVALLAGTTVVLTHSRTGILCLVAYILMALKDYGKISIRPTWKTIIPAIAFTGFSILFFKPESTSGRMFILEQTWELICKRPWSGYGTGGFDREYMNQQAEFFKQHPESPVTMLADETGHPLNEFAYLWVEHGIGAPLVLLLSWAGLWHVLRKRKDISSQIGSYTLIPLLLFALFSYPFKYPLAWIAVGWLRKHSRKDLLQSFFPSKKPEGFGHLLSCFHRNRHRNIPRPCTSARKRMGTCRPRSPQRKGTRNDAPVRTPVPTFLS